MARFTGTIRDRDGAEIQAIAGEIRLAGAGRERVEGSIDGVEPGHVFRVFGQELTLAIDGGPEVGIVPNRHKFGADPFGFIGSGEFLRRCPRAWRSGSRSTAADGWAVPDGA
jgi:hypothetical protein